VVDIIEILLEQRFALAVGVGVQEAAQEALQCGVELHQAGHLNAAQRWYHKSLDLQKENAVAWNHLGGIVQVQGSLETAVTYYNKAIVTKPDYPEAHYNLGNVLKNQGKLDLAIASYQKAIAIMPDHQGANIFWQ
jgi:tetratricopeptide (TPR) repeat protein